MRWIPMDIDGVRRCDCDGEHPILALTERGGDRWFNIRVTCLEADYLAHELGGRRIRASVTYTLIEELLSALGWSLAALRLTNEEDAAMFALVELGRGPERAGVRAYPGDAVVLAARSGLPLDVPIELARTGDRSVSRPWIEDEDHDADVVAFRRLLDDLTPEDFAP